jgi:hypothetical protein
MPNVTTGDRQAVRRRIRHVTRRQGRRLSGAGNHERARFAPVSTRFRDPVV